MIGNLGDDSPMGGGSTEKAVPGAPEVKVVEFDGRMPVVLRPSVSPDSGGSLLVNRLRPISYGEGK